MSVSSLYSRSSQRVSGKVESRRILFDGDGFWGGLWWNCSTSSPACSRFAAGSQVSSSLGNPLQWTRYWSLPRRRRESKTSSTSYSGSPWTSTGSGGGGLRWEGKEGA